MCSQIVDLGNQYYMGLAKDQDHQKAAALYQQTADQGSIALHNLATCYTNPS